jgi:hypothetical protein
VKEDGGKLSGDRPARSVAIVRSTVSVLSWGADYIMGVLDS